MACFKQARYSDKNMLHSYSVTNSHQVLLQAQSTKKDKFAPNFRAKTSNLDISMKKNASNVGFFRAVSFSYTLASFGGKISQLF